MNEKFKEELLNQKEVQAEIHRHLWIESEKVGRDIGFNNAAEDWFNRFSHAWIEYHLPNNKTTKPTSEAAPAVKQKRRSAKTYFKS